MRTSQETRYVSWQFSSFDFINDFQGKAYTAIEPGVGMNDLCLVPDTGLMFMANESPKIMTYYIPVSVTLS